MALDFITGLPPSDGNGVILTIIDRFSKAMHFVPHTKLPTALEKAQLLVQHVFRLLLLLDVGGIGESFLGLSPTDQRAN